MTEPSYVIACSSEWFWAIWEETGPPSGAWHFLRTADDLSEELLAELSPRYVFFPHWSWRVPDSIWRAYECVVFHSTPLPYGRGGSPVQNMVFRGHQATEVCALRMVHELDAGPVYLRRPVSLLGGGDEVFIRIFRAVKSMLHELCATTLEPLPQSGEVVEFRRRRPAQSRIPIDEADLGRLFNHIRILDAEGYPAAFLDYGPYRVHFTRPALRREGVQADVFIELREGEGE